MLDVAFDTIRIAGALDLEQVDTGLRPRRLPAWTRAQITDPALEMMVSASAGVRLTFTTDADAVELDTYPMSVAFVGVERTLPTFDLVVDGSFVGRQRSDSGIVFVLEQRGALMEVRDVIRGDVGTVRFDGLGAGSKVIELWLPHGSAIELRALRVSDGASVSLTPTAARRWVHHGSSISHCLEADGPTGSWPAVAALLAGLDLVHFGFAGQCQLDPFVARTIRDLDVDAISLKVGINIVNGDSFRERTFVPALHGFLDTIREGHPDTPFLVVTPILCPVAEDHPGPTPLVDGQTTVVPRPIELSVGALSLGRIRTLVAEVVGARREGGDRALHLFDGRELFGEGDLADLPDGLHPNAAGYQRMGERFAAHAFAAGGPLAG